MVFGWLFGRKKESRGTLLNLLKGLKDDKWLYEEFKRWCQEKGYRVTDGIRVAIYTFLKNQDDWEIEEPEWDEERFMKMVKDEAEKLAWKIAPQLAQQYMKNMFDFTRSFAELMATFKTEISTVDLEAQIKRIAELSKRLGFIPNTQQEKEKKEENIDELKIIWEIVKSNLGKQHSSESTGYKRMRKIKIREENKEEEKGGKQ